MSTEQSRHALTDFQKGEIVGLRPYLSHHKIGSELDISWRMVSSFLERLEKHQSIEDLPWPGRPHKTSTVDDHFILRTAELKTHVPLAEICVDTSINIFEQTFCQRLRE